MFAPLSAPSSLSNIVFRTGAQARVPERSGELAAMAPRAETKNVASIVETE